MPTLEEKMLENASGPKKAKVDDQEVEQHSLPDLIAFARHKAQAEQAQANRGLGGLLISKVVPPGEVS